jgi:hypothetical protein
MSREDNVLKLFFWIGNFVEWAAHVEQQTNKTEADVWLVGVK